MKRPIACRLGIHKWVVRKDPGIEPYAACKRCQKARLVDLGPKDVGSGGPW